MSALFPTVQEMVDQEFPGHTFLVPGKLAQETDPVVVARYRSQMQQFNRERAATDTEEMRKATIEYAKLALPGCIACADSIIANADEIAAQAVRIGHAFAIELRKL